MSSGKTASSQETCQTQQALLELHDNREKMEEKPQYNEPQQNGTTSAVSQTASQNIVKETEKNLKGQTNQQTPENKTRYFFVQFNPAELVIDASAFQTDQQDSETGQSTKQDQTEPELFLSVTLYFDDVQPYDAFMTEKLNPGVNGSTIASVTNAVQIIEGESIHTVQPQVEALIATLRNPSTRMITFRWADFSFRGILERVSATYTMFSVSGRPVRAKVMLKLRHDTEQENLQPWFDEYDRAFGFGNRTLVKPGQELSSFINFNF